eukprot:TRINITY_DN12901_c0_g2_i1.p2 TRINITY_DN12901_c0_g2~~TRINITY_DN12901_c0_g2_i1.p2  ORF type:complete len:180 (-),score=24.63 TRINITY_DN12901_c0_g2_i1:33-572(-)
MLFFFPAEDGIRDFCLSRGLGDVYKRQVYLLRGKTEKTGWSTVKFLMHRFAAWKSGDGNNTPDLPLTLNAVLVDMPDKETQIGRLGIGQITLRTDLEPVEIMGYPVLPKYHVTKEPVEFKFNLKNRKFAASNYNYTPCTLRCCLLYTSDAADEEDSVDLGGRRIIKKNNHTRRSVINRK